MFRKFDSAIKSRLLEPMAKEVKKYEPQAKTVTKPKKGKTRRSLGPNER